MGSACNALLGIDGEVFGPAVAPDGGDDDGSSIREASPDEYAIAPTALVLTQGMTARLAVFAKVLPAGTSSTFVLEGLPRGVTIAPAAIVVAGPGSGAFDLDVDTLAPLASAKARVLVTRGGQKYGIDLPIEVVGPIDTSFGDGGLTELAYRLKSAVVTPVDWTGTARNNLGLVVLPDQRILVAFTESVGSGNRGRAAIYRLQADGALDRTYGDDGGAALGGDTRAYDLALLDGGAPLVAGARKVDGGLQMWAAVLDPSGSTSDEAVSPLYDSEGIHSIVTLADGNARGVVRGADDDAYLVAVTRTPAFAIGAASGSITTMDPYRLGKDGEGRILVIGRTRGGTPGGRVRARLTSNGGPDDAWGTSGLFTTSGGPSNDLRAGAPAVGGWVFAGSSASAASTLHDELQVARADSDGGLLDGGITRVRPRGTAALAGADALVVLPDGRFIVGGYAEIANVRHAALACFLSNGVLDAKFGLGGLVLVSLGKPAEVKRLALQGSSVIVGVVTTSAADGRDVVLLRLRP